MSIGYLPQLSHVNIMRTIDDVAPILDSLRTTYVCTRRCIDNFLHESAEFAISLRGRTAPLRVCVGRGESALRLAMSKRNVEVVDLLVNNPDIRLNEGGS